MAVWQKECDGSGQSFGFPGLQQALQGLPRCEDLDNNSGGFPYKKVVVLIQFAG